MRSYPRSTYPRILRKFNIVRRPHPMPPSNLPFANPLVDKLRLIKFPFWPKCELRGFWLFGNFNESQISCADLTVLFFSVRHCAVVLFCLYRWCTEKSDKFGTRTLSNGKIKLYFHLCACVSVNKWSFCSCN